jgi:EAL and modified HD-GYP domain-containing signal transduction protein
MLLKDYVTLLPSSQTVVEILESVEPDDLVMAACQRLKESGYMIALDDFAMGDKREPLTDIGDIIQVDVRSTSLEECAAMVKRYGPLALPHAGREGGNTRRIHGRQEGGLCLLSGVLFPPAGDGENTRCPRQPAQLHKDVAGSFQTRTGAAGGVIACCAT